MRKLVRRYIVSKAVSLVLVGTAAGACPNASQVLLRKNLTIAQMGCTIQSCNRTPNRSSR
jgi:hypothetical protein